MADYTINSLNTLVYDAVMSVDPNAFVTSRREPIPNTGTAVYVQHRINEPRRHLLLDGTNTAYTWAMDISVYTNDSNSASSEAYALADAITTALKAEYFRLDSLAPIDNVDPSIFRLEMRFERIIGKGDIPVNISDPNAGDNP